MYTVKIFPATRQGEKQVIFMDNEGGVAMTPAHSPLAHDLMQGWDGNAGFQLLADKDSSLFTTPDGRKIDIKLAEWPVQGNVQDQEFYINVLPQYNILNLNARYPKNGYQEPVWHKEMAHDFFLTCIAHSTLGNLTSIQYAGAQHISSEQDMPEYTEEQWPILFEYADHNTGTMLTMYQGPDSLLVIETQHGTADFYAINWISY